MSEQEVLSWSGYDHIRATMDGRVPHPPMLDLMGVKIVQVERGRIVVRSKPEKQHGNRIGTTHGGFTATVLDTAMALAVNSMAEPGEASATVDLNIHFLKAMSPKTGVVECEGKVMVSRRTLVTAEAWLRDPDGEVCAHATSVFMKIRQ